MSIIVLEGRELQLMEHIVGIGDHAVSSQPNDVIKTFALSTCIGLIYYSRQRRCMGMAHIQLPHSNNKPVTDSPARYADLAPAFLLKEMQQKLGATKNEILVSLYGGIQSKPGDYFKIGERNLENVKNALRMLGFWFSEVDTGGNESRTLVAAVGSGVVEVIKRPMIGK